MPGKNANTTLSTKNGNRKSQRHAIFSEIDVLFKPCVEDTSDKSPKIAEESRAMKLAPGESMLELIEYIVTQNRFGIGHQIVELGRLHITLSSLLCFLCFPLSCKVPLLSTHDIPFSLSALRCPFNPLPILFFLLQCPFHGLFQLCFHHL
jgi:hypothetical protein